MDTEQEGVVHDVQSGEELHVGREGVQQSVLALVSDTDLQTVRKEVIVLRESWLGFNRRKNRININRTISMISTNS